jgi:hypothetical protein
LNYVRAHGGGRVYAGMPSNWGTQFTVGEVPVFKYLESEDIDEVGATLRTASLMTDPEYHFDEKNLGDYGLFAVHYLLLPRNHPPPVRARLTLTDGPYRLWVLPNSGYIRVVDVVGILTANRSNIGSRSVPLLRSPMPEEARYLADAFDGGQAAPLTVMSSSRVIGSPGYVRSESDDLPNGYASAIVVAHRRAAVVLSASFDPGWTVQVDGHTAHTEMLAPALVAVTVPAGVHTVTFSYSGYRYYPELITLGLITLAFMLLDVALVSQRRKRVGVFE